MILDYSEYTEDFGEEGVVNYKQVPNTFDKLQDKRHYCPFCKNKINNLVYSKTNTDIRWCSAIEFENVIQCPLCGWWEYAYTFQSDDIEEGPRARSLTLKQAILKKYEINATDIPIKILNRYIIENPEKIYGINDKKMEELVASVFKEFTDCDIHIVGKSHDGGKDLILVNGEKQSFVQIKRRTKADKVEPVSSIRELLGASILGDATACAFVTTADHFSKPAKEAAQRSVEKKIVNSFELIDYHRLIAMLQLQKEKYPTEWKILLQL